MFNATFNNISVLSLRSILLVEETGVSGENHRTAASHGQTLSHNVVSSTPRLNPTTIRSRRPLAYLFAKRTNLQIIKTNGVEK